MIYSVGVDIVDIARIENVIHRWGDAFLKKILTPLEYEYCHSKVGLAASVAARFAVKEAVYKALPAKVQVGAGWLDVQVVNELSGKPHVQFLGGLEKLLSGFNVHVSISHSRNSAVAMVLFEKEESAD